ncbi:hypothetical protein BDV33DRAFT_23041 [Aspergillus novoparasiticus]|uniref:Uncharacterized protein n=1 Tax=Aspergillus novoparasiticus TaxID=986946 RepID=A0A5N6EBD7_9EURO|nr:hypothetical protein BDV33DRAFT_23041 [Aspergillus novoparasiticus]
MDSTRSACTLDGPVRSPALPPSLLLAFLPPLLLLLLLLLLFSSPSSPSSSRLPLIFLIPSLILPGSQPYLLCNTYHRLQ